MAYRASLSQRAIRDLNDIFEAKEAGTFRPAAAWYVGLRDRIQSLTNMPGKGVAAPDNPGLRQILYGSKPNVYRILYAIDEHDSEVKVVEVRHIARAPLPH